MLRIAIVDDEASIREGLGKMIGRESGRFVVDGLFSNGQDVLDYLGEADLDVIVTDIRMPVVDGLELSKQVKAIKPEIRCIIMSGFKDFEYARQAIRYSAVDYLLKPIDKKQLFALLYALDEEKTAARGKERQIRSGLLLSHFKSFAGGAGLVGPGAKLPELSLPDPYFAVYAIKGWHPEALRAGLEQTLRLPVRFWDLVDTGEPVLAWICYFSQQPDQEELRQLTAVLEAICHPRRTLAGSSFVYGDPAMLGRAYAEAKSACELGIYGSQTWNYREAGGSAGPDSGGPDIGGPDIGERFAACRDEWVEQLQILNVPRAAACLERMLEQVRKDRAPLESVILLCRLVLDTISAELHEWGKIWPRAKAKQLEAELLSCLSFDEIRQKFVDELTGALQQVRAGRLAQAGKSVETVKRWIAEHYNQPAELSQLARMVYLTPSYLSKLFKHETGMTITDYLIEVRIKKAKLLLRKSSELKIHEIGCEVGYPDPAYFNKLFKRMVGVTPNEYKRISQ
ncbi:response regulator [Paenibacillus macerans]|uniref:Response regulator n=1 Tax=Paenibacillus macerans TaxID=44252 RepID=A0A6N8F115_PAEMA|nr:response regulator [Paenibacillus macerans]MUG24800.1 response regulator [Paenibacillus macerans]OMG48232.1 DNA-binding response regulator [Paenibacillus macerans]UMV49324.1 response regulator [Paenibacillus macerans]